MGRTGEERRRAERWGRVAEALAAVMMLLKGYRVLSRRLKTRVGEIDIVAVRGDRLAFVEVKARRSAIEASIALAEQNGDRIAAAADAFLKRQPRYRDHRVALDAVLVSLDRWPEHLPDALHPC
jgi:putative endonuclease